MKKAMLRKLRAISNDILGEEETDKIINETVDNFLKETKQAGDLWRDLKWVADLCDNDKVLE